MQRLKLLLSVVFFTGYLAIQCILCVRSIASDVRLEYGFGMYTNKFASRRPYRVLRSDGTGETFEVERIRPTNELVFRSLETDTVLVYRSAAKPQWTPGLVCRAHSSNVVAIEWSNNGTQQRFPCRD